MELATVHKYSIFIEFPQDGAYRLVEMQHCRNSVKLLHEMLNETVKELVGKKNKTRSTWDAWRALKKLGFLGYCLGQLLRFFRALQISQVLHNSIVHAKA